MRNQASPRTYPSILVPLNLFLLSTAEASLVDELRELLLHHLLDLLDGDLEAVLRCARHMEVQGRVLNTFVSRFSPFLPGDKVLTAAVAMLLSG